MIKIDEWEVLANYTLLITKNQTAFITYKDRGWDLNIAFSYNDHGEDSVVETKIIDMQLHIYLNKWTSEFGTALKEPIIIASLKPSDTKLALMLSSYRIGTTDKLDIQLMQKDGKNE